MSGHQVDHRVIALHNFLVPFVRPVVEKKMDEAIAAASFTEEEVIEISRMFGEMLRAQGASFAEIKAAMKEVRDRLRNPQDVTPEEREEAATDATNEAVVGLVMAWMNVLANAPPGEPDDERTLDLATLDDCMLPPLPEVVEMLFDMFLGPTALEPDDARAVLRAVRASLPTGKTLPDETVALLLAENITVDPA
jgi:hypothetical protein